MQIKITKETYDKLNKDDRLRYIYIQTDPKFERLILEARKNLGIPRESWIDIENNKHGLGSVENSTPLFIPSKYGELERYGNWLEKKRIKKSLRKKISKEVIKLLNKYPVLSSKWGTFLEKLICYNIGNFFPDNFSFGFNPNGSLHIIVSQITTPADLTNWIKANWVRIKNLSVLSVPAQIRATHRKKTDVPIYENLDKVVEIIKLKQVKEKSKKIATKIDIFGKTDEASIDKMYHLIRKQFQTLEKESKEKQEIEFSIFGR